MKFTKLKKKTYKKHTYNKHTYNKHINKIQKKKPNTYAIFLNQKENFDPKLTIYFSFLEKLLQKHSFVKTEPYKTKYIDCFITYIRMPKNFFKINTKLQNNMDDKALAYKSELYEISDKYDHNKTIEYFLQSEKVDRNNLSYYKDLFKNDKVWILKADKSYGGMGNFIVSSYDEFIKIINDHNLDFLLSLYLNKPLLFHKKKMHMRLYIINFINSRNQIKTFLSKYGFILTAKNEYADLDYENKYIHDSHFKTTDTDYLYPNSFIEEYGLNKYKYVQSQIIRIIKYIAKIQKNVIHKYENAPNTYNILGYDFMISEDYQVKLLEINNKTGLSIKTDEVREKMSTYLFTNIYNNIISEVFNTPKEKIDEDFIQIN